MLFDSAKEIRRVIKLFSHFRAGDDKEIVIVAAGVQIVQFRNSQRKLHIQDAGFDIQSAEITDDAGMVLHVNAVISKHSTHGMKYGVIGPVYSAFQAAGFEKASCRLQTFLRMVISGLGQALLSLLHIRNPLPENVLIIGEDGAVRFEFGNRLDGDRYRYIVLEA